MAKKLEKSGGTKFDKEKNLLQLIDPFFLEDLGKVLTYGATKYEAHNFKKGLEVERLIGAAERHLLELRKGIDNDIETDLSHTVHAACNLMFLHWTLKNKPDMDDREYKEGKQK